MKLPGIMRKLQKLFIHDTSKYEYHRRCYRTAYTGWERYKVVTEMDSGAIMVVWRRLRKTASKAAKGKTVANKAVKGKTATDKAVKGKTTANKALNGKTATNKTTANKALKGKTAANNTLKGSL